jgi:hypothetical protein
MRAAVFLWKMFFETFWSSFLVSALSDSSAPATSLLSSMVWTFLVALRIVALAERFVVRRTVLCFRLFLALLVCGMALGSSNRNAVKWEGGARGGRYRNRVLSWDGDGCLGLDVRGNHQF